MIYTYKNNIDLLLKYKFKNLERAGTKSRKKVLKMEKCTQMFRETSKNLAQHLVCSSASHDHHWPSVELQATVAYG